MTSAWKLASVTSMMLAAMSSPGFSAWRLYQPLYKV
jgi:hypothetical protein